MTLETQALAKVIKNNTEAIKTISMSEFNKAQLIGIIYVMKDYARTLPASQVKPFFIACGYPLATL